MRNKKINFALLSTVFVLCGLTPVYGSEITGTLSSGVSGTGSTNTTGGSLSGSVSGGTVLAGNTTGNTSGGGGGSSSSGSSGSSSSNVSDSEVLGATTEVPSIPGLPNTGKTTSVNFFESVFLFVSNLL